MVSYTVGLIHMNAQYIHQSISSFYFPYFPCKPETWQIYKILYVRYINFGMPTLKLLATADTLDLGPLFFTVGELLID